MIAFAVALWSLLWVTAPAGKESAIKSAYPVVPAVEEVRAAFLSLIGFEPSDSEALVAGLAIGERTMLSDETSEQMRELSLTHLVAVSGANLAIVIGAVWFLTAYLGFGRSLRFTIGLNAMLGYVLLVGPESSVIRAATMALFVTVAMWLGRGSSPLHALALAVSLLLIVDPGIATDFGFALSAIATAGLLVAAGPLFEVLKSRMPDWLALGIAAAFSAQLFTTPILLMLQPGLPLYAVLANLLVEPVVAPVTILGISSAVLAVPLPLLAKVGIELASLGTGWIVFVSSQLSEFPFVRLHFVGGPAGVFIAASIVVLAAAYFTSQSPDLKRILLFATGGVVLLGALLSVMDVLRSNRIHQTWEVLNCDVGQGDALLLRSAQSVAMIDVGPDPDLLRECLETASVEQVDLLIISHYDADHVAGIDALEGIDIGLAVLPGFEDDRPLADKVQVRMNQWAKSRVIGQRGMSGELGSCIWRILEPSFSASETSDSNDASLVALFDCKDYRLLALGDLGEQGQDRLLASSAFILRSSTPLVLKVAHHGSADQSRELHEYLAPEVALVSVGSNRFGHPTDRLLRILNSTGASVFRTDESGAISVQAGVDGLSVGTGGKLAR